MWGGKTEGLISRLVRARIQMVRVLAFNPRRNTRDAAEVITSHSGGTFPAIPVSTAREILDHASDADVIGIDEVFMMSGVSDVVRELTRMDKKVVMATLDMDSDGNVWESVGEVLALAEEVVKCPAVCSKCKRDAYYTYRLPEAPDSRVLVGAADFYEPRCFECWSEGQQSKKRQRGQKQFFATSPELPA